MTNRIDVQREVVPDEVWTDLVEAFDSARATMEQRAAFADKWLVRGQLLVTQQQLDQIQRIATAQRVEAKHSPFIPSPPGIGDVPLRVVGCEPVDLGGGLQAIHSEALKAIVVFKEFDHLAKVDLPPVDDRYPSTESHDWT